MKSSVKVKNPEISYCPSNDIYHQENKSTLGKGVGLVSVEALQACQHLVALTSRKKEISVSESKRTTNLEVWTNQIFSTKRETGLNVEIASNDHFQ